MRILNEDPSLGLAGAVCVVTLTEIKPETKLLMEPELREGSLLIQESTHVRDCHFFGRILDFSTFF